MRPRSPAPPNPPEARERAAGSRRYMVWSALLVPPGDRPQKARHHTENRGNGATLTVAGGPNGTARLSPVYPGPGGNPHRRRNGGRAHRRTAEGAAAAAAFRRMGGVGGPAVSRHRRWRREARGLVRPATRGRPGGGDGGGGGAAARPAFAGRKGEDPASGRLAALAQMAEHRDAGRGARAQAGARRPPRSAHWPWRWCAPA